MMRPTDLSAIRSSLCFGKQDYTLAGTGFSPTWFEKPCCLLVPEVLWLSHSHPLANHSASLHLLGCGDVEVRDG